MKVAVTVWDQRISPVFDAAHTLLIADIHHQKIKKISYLSLYPDQEARMLEDLNLMDIEVLICGAISRMHADLITSRNIRLIPFITGDVSEILKHLAAGKALPPSFLMPGCNFEPQTG